MAKLCKCHPLAAPPRTAGGGEVTPLLCEKCATKEGRWGHIIRWYTSLVLVQLLAKLDAYDLSRCLGCNGKVTK
jgi:hypothetical protein